MSHDTTLAQLQNQLNDLKRDLAVSHRHTRRWRRGVIAAAALGGGLLLLGAADITRLDVVRAHRLEILNGDGRVVLAAGGDALGGRLDVWTPTGDNIIRLGGNENGGDLAIWNDTGVNIAGLWATDAGGTIAAWNRGGKRGATVSANDDGGRIDIGTAIDAITCRIGSGEDAIVLDHPETNQATTMRAGTTMWTHNDVSVIATSKGNDTAGLTVSNGNQWALLSATQAIVADATLDGLKQSLTLGTGQSIASTSAGLTLSTSDTSLAVGSGRLTASLAGTPWLTTDIADGQARCDLRAGVGSTMLTAGDQSGVHVAGRAASMVLAGTATESVTLASDALSPVLSTQAGGITMLASKGAGRLVLGGGEAGQVQLIGGTDGQRPSIDVLAPGGQRVASMSTTSQFSQDQPFWSRFCSQAHSRNVSTSKVPYFVAPSS